MIVVAGLADLPDPMTLRDTPLAEAHTPALDMLARRGEISSFPTLSEEDDVNHKNALLSILGYDLERGEPSTEELMEFGLNHSNPLTDYPTLRPFIIPGFSGHGLCVTTSAWVRGVAKCALLKPVDIYSPGSSDAEILNAVANLTKDAIGENEFVLVYVDSPLKASLRGDFNAKIEALASIDQHLIGPLADYVWKSELLINLAITSDLVTSWHTRCPARVSVPTILYYNNHDWEGDPEMKFTEMECLLSLRLFDEPSDLIRYLSNFNVHEEETGSEEMPF